MDQHSNEPKLNAYDASELVRLCETVVEDGELSRKEVHDLAKWLNEHHEAHSHWPGDLLFPALRNAYRDHDVTKEEMRSIGRILLQIRRQWGKRQPHHEANQGPNDEAKIIAAIDLSRSMLPLIEFKVRINSHSTKGVFYDVDLSGPTCTCPNWLSWRRALKPAHLSRCCKHVFDAYAQVKPRGGWPGWLGAFLHLAWPPHPHQDWMVLSIDGTAILASTAPRGWADVFADEEGQYDRFGYNVVEDRWAYGIEPPHCKEIAKAIAAVPAT